MTVWVVVFIAGRLFSAPAMGMEDCAKGAAFVQAWADANHRKARVSCVLSEKRPRGSSDLIEWIAKGDA